MERASSEVSSVPVYCNILGVYIRMIRTSCPSEHAADHDDDNSSTKCHSQSTEAEAQSDMTSLKGDDAAHDKSIPTVELRQTLMVADEVYLYKIPPLQTSGGHRYVFFFETNSDFGKCDCVGVLYLSIAHAVSFCSFDLFRVSCIRTGVINVLFQIQSKERKTGI